MQRYRFIDNVKEHNLLDGNSRVAELQRWKAPLNEKLDASVIRWGRLMPL